MSIVDIIMPKMGESITDATIIKWYKKVGDKIDEEETLLEVATDKVDSEIPSPVKGIVASIIHKEEEVVDVGEVIATINIGSSDGTRKIKKDENGRRQTTDDRREVPTEHVGTTEERGQKTEQAGATPLEVEKEIIRLPTLKAEKLTTSEESTRFYSPLVKSIATKEGISKEELDTVEGRGAKGRVTKKDIMAYVKGRRTKSPITAPKAVSASSKGAVAPSSPIAISSIEKDEIVEMDRMRKLIAEHMVNSKRTSAHVTSFAEADVSAVYKWRNRVKAEFLLKHGQKLTFTPIFVEALAKSIREHPGVNVSIDGNKIIYKKDINIGIATALPSGNLIVPVILNADLFNLHGITKNLNDKVERARNNKLDPTEIQNGTFTLTNIGTYGNILGTPIINQPQVAILATGAIKKKPVVIETKEGDAIGVRHMMYLSLSYDHRVVDGYMGGTFLQTVVNHLENFDDTREI